MKNFTMVLALIMSAFTFGQDKGQYTFGVGSDFTNFGSHYDGDNGVTGNVGYFVMDNIMISLEFEMATESADDAGDDYMNWGIGARYYIGEDGLWAGLSVNNAEWIDCLGMTCSGTDSDGNCLGMTCSGTEEATGMDIWLGAGCSKVLGFDGKLWFEPHVGVTMPADSDQMVVGLGMGFRFAF